MSQKLEEYPEGGEYEGGCKVAWLTYSDKASADRASEIALRNATIREAQGFDFGYCAPGSIDTFQKDGVPMFRVCIP